MSLEWCRRQPGRHDRACRRSEGDGSRPTSRREFLRAAGGAAGLAALAPVLAACTSGDERRRRRRAERVVHVANWPLYLDRERRTRRLVPASLARAVHRGDGHRGELPRGDPGRRGLLPRHPGLARGGGAHRLGRHGHHERPHAHEADRARLPRWSCRSTGARTSTQNASDLVTDPVVRPGQPLLDGVAVGHHRHRVRPPTARSVASRASRDLFDAEFEGKVGMFGDLVDLPNLAILAVGADPETSTADDWKDAAKLLRRPDAIAASCGPTSPRTTSTPSPTATWRSRWRGRATSSRRTRRAPSTSSSSCPTTARCCGPTRCASPGAPSTPTTRCGSWTSCTAPTWPR